MDIGSGKAVEQREEEGTVITVRDEAGEKMVQDDGTTPVTIAVVGTYSSTYRRAAEAQRDRNIKRRAFNLDGDQLDQQSLELVAACILAWDGFTSGAGTPDVKPYPLTKANAVTLLRAFPWIRQQVEAAMNDHSAFFPKPSPSSVSA